MYICFIFAQLEDQLHLLNEVYPYYSEFLQVDPKTFLSLNCDFFISCPHFMLFMLLMLMLCVNEPAKTTDGFIVVLNCRC